MLTTPPETTDGAARLVISLNTITHIVDVAPGETVVLPVFEPGDKLAISVAAVRIGDTVLEAGSEDA